jgi:hypothetical protein
MGPARNGDDNLVAVLMLIVVVVGVVYRRGQGTRQFAGINNRNIPSRVST